MKTILIAAVSFYSFGFSALARAQSCALETYSAPTESQPKKLISNESIPLVLDSTNQEEGGDTVFMDATITKDLKLERQSHFADGDPVLIVTESSTNRLLAMADKRKDGVVTLFVTYSDRLYKVACE